MLKSFLLSAARAFAKVTGNIIFMSPIIGDITRLMTRSLYSASESRVPWEYPIALRNNVNVLEELKFWKDNDC